jgi:hypothetical protein
VARRVCLRGNWCEKIAASVFSLLQHHLEIKDRRVLEENFRILYVHETGEAFVAENDVSGPTY